MKPLLACTALLMLIACNAPAAPSAAAKECGERHGLTVGSAEYNDCVAKLRNSN